MLAMRKLRLEFVWAALVCSVVGGTLASEAAAAVAQGEKVAEARFFVVDVGLGNCVFVVAPSGEVLLLDTGADHAAMRVLAFMEQKSIHKIDYLLVSHFENDHMGAAPMIAEKVPVGCFVDHGESIVYAKDDAWWKQRRGPWFRDGMGQRYDQSFDAYRKVRSRARHIVVKPGDRVPIKGLDVDVVSAAGQVITQPLAGTGAINPACEGIDRRTEDDAEDGQSVGVVVRYGEFRFVDLGDLTWNTANKLFCPRNLIGVADAYLVTHHAFRMSRELGDYYHGVSSCSAAEVYGLHPRAAILSLAAHGHKYGTPDAMKLLHSVPELDLWQTQFIREGGEKGCNGPKELIANLGKRGEQVPHIELAAAADGSFKMTNSRNGYTKRYPPRK